MILKTHLLFDGCQNAFFKGCSVSFGAYLLLESDPLGARTQDPNIKSVVLYLLS